MEAHSGQSILADALSPLPFPSRSTSFIPPLAAQTIWTLPGLITAAATADPKKSPNHASTKLAMNLELRRACTGPIIALQVFASGG